MNFANKLRCFFFDHLDGVYDGYLNKNCPRCNKCIKPFLNISNLYEYAKAVQKLKYWNKRIEAEYNLSREEWLKLNKEN